MQILNLEIIIVNNSTNKAEYIKQKSKIYKIYKENKKITDLALKLDKRITIVDDRPHKGWSTNISQLYGMSIQL